jgi:hypothetical protein
MVHKHALARSKHLVLVGVYEELRELFLIVGNVCLLVLGSESDRKLDRAKVGVGTSAERIVDLADEFVPHGDAGPCSLSVCETNTASGEARDRCSSNDVFANGLASTDEDVMIRAISVGREVFG